MLCAYVLVDIDKIRHCLLLTGFGHDGFDSMVIYSDHLPGRPAEVRI